MRVKSWTSWGPLTIIVIHYRKAGIISLSSKLAFIKWIFEEFSVLTNMCLCQLIIISLIPNGTHPLIVARPVSQIPWVEGTRMYNLGSQFTTALFQFA